MKKFACSFALMFFVSSILLINAAHAAEDPPTRWLIGYPPGGGADVTARLVAEQFTKRLKIPLILENVPGATGTIAAAKVARGRPDGTELLVGATATNVIAPLVYKGLSYNSREDLIPIISFAVIPSLIVVSPRTDIKSVAELIRFAKANPNEMKFASAGIGSLPHIVGEEFKKQTGVEMIHIPYKGSGQAIPDLISGRLQVNFDSSGTLMSPVKNKLVRPLAIASKTKLPSMPDLPTTAEAGLPGFEFATWVGLFAPKGTPPAIIKRIHAQIYEVLQDPDLKQRLVNDLGHDGSFTRTPAEFLDIVNSDIEKYKTIVQQLNIKVE